MERLERLERLDFLLLGFVFFPLCDFSLPELPGFDLGFDLESDFECDLVLDLEIDLDLDLRDLLDLLLLSPVFLMESGLFFFFG